MDIFIKSFNRTFYLRPLFAKHRKLCRRRFWVKVLDDGTPEKYLQKIKEKHLK